MGKKVRIYTAGENNRIQFPKDQVYGAFFDPGEDFINIVVNHRAKLFTPEAKFALVANPSIIHRSFKCRSCQMIFDLKRNREQHEKTCSVVKPVKTRQKALGDNENELIKLVKTGYLPEKFLNYRQKWFVVFDIETLETKTEEAVSDYTVKEATHKLASLAMGSNIPGSETKFMLRQSSEPIAEQMLIDNFVEELYKLYDLYMDNIPPEIQTTIDRLESEIAELNFGFKKTQLQVWG